MKNTELFPTVEISGAVLTDLLASSDLHAFNNDPKGYMLNHLRMDLSEITVEVVCNDENEVHLALPYYSLTENLQAEMLQDSCIDDITGGEIVITLGVIFGAGTAYVVGAGTTGIVISGILGGALLAVGSAAVGVGAAAWASALDDENIDGSPK